MRIDTLQITSSDDITGHRIFHPGDVNIAGGLGEVKPIDLSANGDLVIGSGTTVVASGEVFAGGDLTCGDIAANSVKAGRNLLATSIAATYGVSAGGLIRTTSYIATSGDISAGSDIIVGGDIFVAGSLYPGAGGRVRVIGGCVRRIIDGDVKSISK